MGYSLSPVPREDLSIRSSGQCSQPQPGPAPAAAAIRPDGLAAEKVLSRRILRFEPAAEKKGKESGPCCWAMWSGNVVLCFGTCFLNDTSVFSSSGDPGASLRIPLTLS